LFFELELVRWHEEGELEGTWIVSLVQELVRWHDEEGRGIVSRARPVELFHRIDRRFE